MDLRFAVSALNGQQSKQGVPNIINNLWCLNIELIPAHGPGAPEGRRSGSKWKWAGHRAKLLMRDGLRDLIHGRHHTEQEVCAGPSSDRGGARLFPSAFKSVLYFSRYSNSARDNIQINITAALVTDSGGDGLVPVQRERTQGARGRAGAADAITTRRMKCSVNSPRGPLAICTDENAKRSHGPTSHGGNFCGPQTNGGSYLVPPGAPPAAIYVRRGCCGAACLRPPLPRPAPPALLIDDVTFTLLLF
ncbi:hypothetical protein EVAR_40071_1 [Eumeta japonica]|uniref:Uncharacterized protein n=1 Tax=Eumeta variegata TaxID=151549 RepID=A0A4C1X315_EUMVA|nr:hypothetical protein EVAR_40071_1 [Eumeta japonica]